MAEKKKKARTFTNDQNFKNLILDYPRAALEFFAAAEAASISPDTRILPIREEQLKDRLGDHFHELDTPLLAEWPNGERKAMVFVVEEETDPRLFSIHRLARYCLHVGELLETDRVVPVVIFLKPGDPPLELRMSGDCGSYLHFRYISADLGRIPAEKYMTCSNIVARLNLPNMAYDPDKKIEVYSSAQDGLMELEKDLNKRIKYMEYIDYYARLTRDERKRYTEEYLSKSSRKEEIMSLREMWLEEGREEGIQQGKRSLLWELLSRRFGSVPAWTEERLNQAKQKDLETWSARILEAKTLEEIFEGQRA